MAEENTQPIVFKKIKKGGHGHHGGAWKIAYADFVTAMMAFFLLMWLMGSTTREEKAAISDYFNNPTPFTGPGGASTNMIKVGGGKDVTYSEGETKRGSNPDTKPKKTEPDKQRLLGLKKELEQAIEASQALKPFKDQLLLDITKEGLRIQIVDKENRPMFASGSSTLQPYAASILHEIGEVVNRVPNMISLSGHTDATPYSAKPGITYSNWELSADRANASRRALQEGGMDEGKVARVVGLSSAVLFDKANPFNPINRRISIIVLNKETEDAILHDEGKLDQVITEVKDADSTVPAGSPVPAPIPAQAAPSVKPGAIPENIRPSPLPVTTKPAAAASTASVAAAASAAAASSTRH